MLAKLITAIMLFILSISFQVVMSPVYCNESVTVYSVRTNITYEREFHDGYWWIIIYENDIKITEYLDPDQD